MKKKTKTELGFSDFGHCAAFISFRFGTDDRSFENEEEAKVWIICNQLARRNLTREQMAYLRGLRYNLEKKQPDGFEDRDMSGDQRDHRSTAEKIAKETGVSAPTIRRDAQFADAVDKLPPKEKKEVLYCPQRVWNFIFQLAHTDKTKKEAEKACKDLSENNRGIVKRNLTFTASETAYVAFSMGYVMGQLYNVKDREHLPVIKRLFKEHLVNAERRASERKSLPYIGKATKRLEKKAA